MTESTKRYFSPFGYPGELELSEKDFNYEMKIFGALKEIAAVRQQSTDQEAIATATAGMIAGTMFLTDRMPGEQLDAIIDGLRLISDDAIGGNSDLERFFPQC